MQLLLVVLVVVGAFWVLATALYQFREHPWVKPIFEWLPADILGVLPIWTFFSPVPGHTDVHVIYRYRLSDERLTEWQTVDAVTPRSITSGIFNPRRRLTKALIDIVSEVTRSSHVDADLYNGSFILQPPHLFLLNLALSTSTPPKNGKIQYVLYVTRGFSEDPDIQVICKSDFHDVD